MLNINGGQWPPLRARILSTLTFFDLQDYPLTLLELHKFLIVENIQSQIDEQGELLFEKRQTSLTSTDKILECIYSECAGEVQNTMGFYHLSGRGKIAHNRLRGYFFGLKREKLIKKYVKYLKFLPFVRGVALAGSQAMGRQKESSDIDLLIITSTNYLWLARTMVTAYFQLLGLRRHGKKIANRFCLNHYLAGPKKIAALRNLYTASEYLKLRPLVNAGEILEFERKNSDWLQIFFPNASAEFKMDQNEPGANIFLENVFNNFFGRFLDAILKKWQLAKIKKEKFIVVEENELSFHPDSKQQALLAGFFKLQKQNVREPIELVV